MKKQIRRIVTIGIIRARIQEILEREDLDADFRKKIKKILEENIKYKLYLYGLWF